MSRTFPALLLALLCLSSAPGLAHAQAPAGDDVAGARAVVEDLMRIPGPDGVQETYPARIGGIDQWISIRGQDRANPVILFVHGGPATPTIPSLWQFQRPLEDYFTMVNYDQRGAGKTYAANDPDAVSDTIHVQQFVADLIEVAEHTRDKLGKDKLVLMAHSWGTIPAMHAARQRPDLFHAYVGIGQVINVRDNERLSIAWGLEQARRHGNAEAVAEIESIMPYPGDEPITRERIVTARKWPQHYGGMAAFRDETNLWFYGAARLSPDYDADDRAALNAGSLFTLGRVLDEFVQVDFNPVREFPVPVVMFMGRHDYTTPSQLTAEWLQRVEAPYKQAVWFERSAHMPPWEEPGRFLVSLLEHVRPLAEE
ncbi:alpha/beta fold hydrolase [Luteimonas dalianensis]|uniref:alpha/beta fold hydrolase n=1 Tax=Luteimonas dalianensis TaxID=1148196 RepID=UPI003BF3D8F4